MTQDPRSRLRTGPAVYVGMHGRLDLPCRVVRVCRDFVLIRFADQPAEPAHPDHLQQKP